MMTKQKQRPLLSYLQLLLHILAWLPLLWLFWSYWQGQLGLNPVRAITLHTGKTALILLLLSLTITPLYLIFNWGWVYRWRRPLGLYAFMYAGLHFLTFVGLDYAFDFSLVGDALRTNRYTLIGLTSFVIMIPLALTSSRRMRRRMGEKRWQWLHRWVYLSAGLAILHFALLVRQYYTRPIIFGTILAALLGVRLLYFLMRRQQVAGGQRP